MCCLWSWKDGDANSVNASWKTDAANVENNPQRLDGEWLKLTFQDMTPVQDIYILPKKQTPHTHNPASTVCHVALFRAVLVWPWVCVCVNSQTKQVDENKTGLGGKFQCQLSALKLRSSLLECPLCIFAQMKWTAALLQLLSAPFSRSDQVQAVNATSHHGLSLA